MADYTYRISASGTATGADRGATTFSAARDDFVANNRMGAGVGVVAASSTLFFKFDGMVGSGDGQLYGITNSASGAKIVMTYWSNPWRASAATPMGDTTAFDGQTWGDATTGIWSGGQGGNIEVRGLVFRKTAGAGTLWPATNDGSGSVLVEDCLFINTSATPIGVSTNTNTTLRNCLIFFTAASQSGTVWALSLATTAVAEHVTAVSLGGIGTLANSGGSAGIVKNSYVHLGSTPWAGLTWGGTSVGNASSGTGTPNSGLNSVAFSTTNFESVTGTGDFRVKSGSVLKTTGAARLATTLLDAYGQSRGTTATIGAAEPAVTLNFTGTATLGAVIAGGSLQSVMSGFTAGALLGSVSAGGSLGATPGVFVLGPIKVNGTAQAGVAIDWVRIYSDAGILLYERTGGTLDGTGSITLTTNTAPPGTAVRIDWQLSGGRRRMPRVTMG